MSWEEPCFHYSQVLVFSFASLLKFTPSLFMAETVLMFGVSVLRLGTGDRLTTVPLLNMKIILLRIAVGMSWWPSG